MACYCSIEVCFKSRTFSVPLRYGSYGMGGTMEQVAGKPFRLTPKQQTAIAVKAEKIACCKCW